MFRYLTVALTIAVFSMLPATAQDSDHNKNLDIRSSVGDLHVGADADAHKAGLPLYPGARAKSGDDNNDKVNLGLFTEAFGIKLVVASYDSDDAPDKIIGYYRDKLGKYGKVLECHSKKHGSKVNLGDDDKDDKDKDSDKSKTLKCDGDNTGPITELKAGTEDNQHVVAVEPQSSGKGTTFAIVYVHAHGKEGDI